MTDTQQPAARRPRGSYAPTVLAGLAGAALAAVGGARTWASGHGFAAGIRVEAAVKGSEVAPLVGALGLLALASWGVVLVTRGRTRRAVAVVGLLASAGALAAALLGFGDADDTLRGILLDKGAGAGSVVIDGTLWPSLAVLGALVVTVSFAVAVAKAPRWPAMGSRYDAPAARPRPATGPTANEQDMWRALDEGHDPTS